MFASCAAIRDVMWRDVTVQPEAMEEGQVGAAGCGPCSPRAASCECCFKVGGVLRTQDCVLLLLQASSDV